MAQAAQRKPVQSADTDLSQLFKEFHSRHRDADGNKLKFTAVFNSYLEATIASGICLELRAVAWLIRYSWGNNSDYAVETFGGRTLKQADFARRVHIDRRRASELFAELEAHGFLLPQSGKALYPVDDPARAVTPKVDNNCPALTDISPFLRWCEEEWNVLAPADSQALKDAEETVRKLKLVRWGLWRQAVRARTNGGPIIIEETYNSLTTKKASSSEFPTAEPTTTTSPIEIPQESPEPVHNGTVVNQEAQFHEEVTQAFAGKGSPTPGQLRKAYTALPPAAPVATFVEYLKRRMPRLKHPGGLQQVVMEFAREWRTCGGTVEAWNAERRARGPLSGIALMLEEEKAKRAGGAS